MNERRLASGTEGQGTQRPEGALRFSKSAHGFSGPIFIVGMPRSGTKLLRDLLNHSSRIAIPPEESHFIPFASKRIGRYGDLRKSGHFAAFYRDISRTMFFKAMTKREPFIDRESWYAAVEEWSYAGIIRTLFEAYCRKKGKDIWGDKTPSYMLHLYLLKDLFPQARFVHILRDVRDYCLSVQKAWGKNLFRAAQRWHDSIEKCRRDASGIGSEGYLEVHYERLIDSPEAILRSVCEFLQLAYEPSMLQKPIRSENIGSAKDHDGILDSNYGKWKKALDPGAVRKIESISADLLRCLGYPVTYSGPVQRLGPNEMRFYKYADGFHLLQLAMREQTLPQALELVWRTKSHRAVSKGTM
ncbi:MAG: sulfotransferase [bacterium]